MGLAAGSGGRGLRADHRGGAEQDQRSRFRLLARLGGRGGDDPGGLEDRIDVGAPVVPEHRRRALPKLVGQALQIGVGQGEAVGRALGQGFGLGVG